MYLHFNRLVKFHLCHFSVLSYLYSIWTPVEGGSADKWLWPSYLWSLLCPVLRLHCLRARMTLGQCEIFLHTTHLLSGFLSTRYLSGQHHRGRACLNVETVSDPSEAASPSHLWVVISNLLNNSYLFSISLPITGLFVRWAPTQTPCCIFLLPCNICIAIYSFFLNRVTPVFHYAVSPRVLWIKSLNAFKALRPNKINNPNIFPHTTVSII